MFYPYSLPYSSISPLQNGIESGFLFNLDVNVYRLSPLPNSNKYSSPEYLVARKGFESFLGRLWLSLPNSTALSFGCLLNFSVRIIFQIFGSRWKVFKRLRPSNLPRSASEDIYFGMIPMFFLLFQRSAPNLPNALG
jgi:hypothetical protein